VALYPKFQEYFRTKRPPIIAVWGKNDPFFLPRGVDAFRRSNPNSKVLLYDTGHFALETHATEIAKVIRDFLSDKPTSHASGELLVVLNYDSMHLRMVSPSLEVSGPCNAAVLLCLSASDGIALRSAPNGRSVRCLPTSTARLI
jgi:hypothetical protein